MEILIGIAPIFLIIALGWLGDRAGFFPDEFMGPASRLVYFLAIPALMFRAVAKTSPQVVMVLTPALRGSLSLFIQWLLAIAASRFLLPADTDPARRASWVAVQIHGNLGVVGIAVVYYIMGQEWLGQAGMVIGVLLCTHYILATAIYKYWGAGGGNLLATLTSMTQNPIVIAIVLGLIIALSGLPLPKVADETIRILSGLGLPLALLMVGAELNRSDFSSGKLAMLSALTGKMLTLPAIFLLLAKGLGAEPQLVMVTMAMICPPTAVAAMILAKQMKGDARFAASVISLGHLLAPLGYVLWFNILAV